MAFTVRMSALFVMSAVVIVHLAQGYRISECGSDGRLETKESQPVTLTCTGITDDTVFWDLSNSLMASCTWPSSSCRVTNSAWYAANRTQYTSTLTVRHDLRTSIAGTVRCVGNNTKTAAFCNVIVIVREETTKTTTTSALTSAIQTTTTATTTSSTPTVPATFPSHIMDDNEDDDNNRTAMIAGAATGVIIVVIAAVVATIIVWKKRCEPIYAKPTRRSQIIDINTYTGLGLQQHHSDTNQAQEEDVYEDTTGQQQQQQAAHDTVVYVNSSAARDHPDATIYVNV